MGDWPMGTANTKEAEPGTRFTLANARAAKIVETHWPVPAQGVSSGA